MSVAITTLGAVALLLAGVLRLGSRLRTPRPWAGHLGAAAIASGIALGLNNPDVYVWSDRVLFQHANASALASYLLTVAAAGAAVDMVASMMGGELIATRRLRWAAFGTVAVGMVVAFVVGAPSHEAPSFFTRYRHDPDLMVFWVLFCSSVVVATCYIAVTLRRVAHGDDRHVARGLRMIGTGMCCVAAFLIDCLLQVALPNASVPGGEAIMAAGGLLLAAGMLWPQLATWVHHSTAQRQLRPLWSTVTERYPYVRSSAQRPGLYRTVIEIEDAIAEARAHHEIDTPLLQQLDALTAHPAELFDSTVQDLVRVASDLGTNERVRR